MSDLISRKAAIEAASHGCFELRGVFEIIKEEIEALPSALSEQPQKGYEYHYDHTDCIYYNVRGRAKCPVTCSQYRDGWNDAMNYIFKNGEGYKPYRREG